MGEFDMFTVFAAMTRLLMQIHRIKHGLNVRTICCINSAARYLTIHIRQFGKEPGHFHSF